MIKMIKVIGICLLLISIIGCGSKQNDNRISNGESADDHDRVTSGNKDVSDSHSTIELKTIGFKYDTDESLGIEYIYAGRGDSVRLGVDKTLIWTCEKNDLNDMDPAIISYFNELLVNKYGCDFTVEIRGYNTLSSKLGENGLTTGVNEYQEYLINAKNQGEQIDILYTGSGMAYMNTYMNAVKQGLLVKLDDILETDAARNIKAVFNEAEKIRYFCVDGIYCIPRTSYSLDRSYVLVNTKFAEELGIEVPCFSDINACIDWLFTLEPYVESERTLVFISNAVDFFDAFGGYVRVVGGLYEHEKEDGSWEYVNVAEEEYYHRLWEKLYLLNEKQICTIANEDRVRFNNGDFLCCFVNLSDMDFQEGKLGLADGTEIEVDVVCSGERYFDRKKICATGIASWSEYTNEAVKLFSLLMSEPELINVINSGIEGVHYELVDGELKALTTDSGMIFYNIPLNNDYAYACAGADLKGNLISGQLNRIKPAGGAIYQTDLSEYKDELAIIAGSNNSLYISKLNSGELWGRESYEALLQEFRDRMNELGLNEIVNGLNAQLKGEQERE